MVTRKKTEARLFVPYKRSEREEMKEEKEKRPMVLDDLKRTWDREDRNGDKERRTGAGMKAGAGRQIGTTAKTAGVKGGARGRVKIAARR